MQVTLNGQSRDIPDGATLAELLHDLALSGRAVAVERNREVVPRELHQHLRLQAGDELEVVTLVGGG